MIPLKIETLLAGKVVEQNRVEYKEGWNPNDIIHTICAFANDYPNINGGYIVIGVKAEDGIPVLPPTGLPHEKLDLIQQELFQYCNQLLPRYIPNIEVVDYQNSGIYLLYLWCSAGDCGPYQAPVDLYAKNDRKAPKRREYWIRPASVTVAAKQEEISELYDKFNSIPYDDRINRKATLDDIRRGYVEDFLRDSNSSLAAEINRFSLEEMLVALEVANETDAGIDIRNIGILMFADRPDKFIPGAQIDLVWFHTKEAEGADDFTEKTFYGPIWKQVRDAMDYIRNNVIEEKVTKIQGQMESIRYFSYPYNALEEMLVNAVFHKSYRQPEPVEIRIYVDSIVIINYPGLAKWIDLEKFAAGKVRPRMYRNRRIGEMFKEIDLSEKQGTGITKILNAIHQNGSMEPEYEMDEDRVYFAATLPIREGFESLEDVYGDHVNAPEKLIKADKKPIKADKKPINEKRHEVIIDYITENGSISNKEARELLCLTESTTKRILRGMVESGILEFSGERKSRRYYLSRPKLSNEKEGGELK